MAVGVLCLPAAFSKAAILYDNYLPGDGYDTGTVFPMGDYETGDQSYAMYFGRLLPGGANITSVTLSLAGGSGGDPYNVSVASVDNFGVPTPIYTWAGVLGGATQTLNVVGPLHLNYGPIYAIEAKMQDGFLETGGWYANASGAKDGYSYYYNLAGWAADQFDRNGVMRIEGEFTQTPEPVTLLSLGAGMLVLAVRRRRR